MHALRVSNTPPTTMPLADFESLAERFACRAAPVLRRYEQNSLIDEMILPAASEMRVSFANAEWHCRWRAMPVSDHPGTFDLELAVTLVHGRAEAVGIGLGCEFSDWSHENYVLLPAAIYAGNNFKVTDIPYPPLWRDPAEFSADMPITITRIPRLAPNSPRLEQTTGDLATPAMGFHSADRNQGFLLFTRQGTPLGNNGLTVEHLDGGRRARFLLTAPAVRAFRQAHCRAVPSDDRAATWHGGDQVSLQTRVCFISASQLQSLFDRFCEMRKCLNASNPRPELPFSAAWRLIEEKYNQQNWDEEHGYYKLAPNAHTTFEVAENPLCFLWQLGWVGGGMMTLPMLAQGGQLTRKRAWHNLRMIFEKTATPSGFFLGSGDGARFYSDSFDRPHPHNLHLVRKSGDWLFFGLKQLDLLRKQKHEVPDLWFDRLQELANAFVRLWEANKQFGQFVDVSNGELRVGGSANGAIIPAALTLAAQQFQNPEYLRVAVASAQKYYDEFILRGLTTGGPGEILSAPDSESAFALLESFVALLEATGDPFWAKAARATMRQAATWVVSYDYEFPPDSALGRSGARSTGAVWANVQNKHGAPGICTLSGDSLLRLWRATNDALALELLRDIAQGIPQYLSRADRPLGDTMQPGWMCERVNLSDWEGAAGVGGQLFGSCSWAETALMLTTWEIPGLYVQPETGFYCVFDHIIATRLRHSDGKLWLQLTNPTRFDAEVKVLNESAAARQQPLAMNALLDAPVIILPAGETRSIKFDSFDPHNFSVHP
jgi:hypothetical protein